MPLNHKNKRKKISCPFFYIFYIYCKLELNLHLKPFILNITILKKLLNINTLLLGFKMFEKLLKVKNCWNISIFLFWNRVVKKPGPWKNSSLTIKAKINLESGNLKNKMKIPWILYKNRGKTWIFLSLSYLTILV